LSAGSTKRTHTCDDLADLSGTFLDTAGKPLTMPLSRQVIGISAEQLHAVPDVICIAYGRDKAPAVAAAVGAGYVTTLVTTAALAQELLTATKG
jgi:DNA-binding transcriptional regulator LsrR (DeoR family)